MQLLLANMKNRFPASAFQGTSIHDTFRWSHDCNFIIEKEAPFFYIKWCHVIMKSFFQKNEILCLLNASLLLEASCTGVKNTSIRYVRNVEQKLDPWLYDSTFFKPRGRNCLYKNGAPYFERGWYDHRISIVWFTKNEVWKELLSLCKIPQAYWWQLAYLCFASYVVIITVEGK